MALWQLFYGMEISKADDDDDDEDEKDNDVPPDTFKKILKLKEYILNKN